MARKKADATEEVVEAAVETPKAKAAAGSDVKTYELADRYKQAKNFFVNGRIIPVEDGKVLVGGESHKALLEGGYLK